MKARNKLLIITGIGLLVLSAILFIVAGLIAGWDFASFFKSNQFVWIIVVVIVYLVVAGFILIYDRLNK